MKFSRICSGHLAAKLVPVAAVVGAASFMASGSYSSEPAQTTRYLCRDGERFAVEHLDDHVRLRTGSGVFALAIESAGGTARYSDGHTVFRLNGDEAVLERPGLATTAGCTVVANTL